MERWRWWLAQQGEAKDSIIKVVDCTNQSKYPIEMVVSRARVLRVLGAIAKEELCGSSYDTFLI